MKIINFLLRSLILLFTIFISLSILYFYNVPSTVSCEGVNPSTLDNMFWKIEEQRENVWHVFFRNVGIKYEVMMCSEDTDTTTSRFELREIGPNYPGLFRPSCLDNMYREERIEFITQNNQSYEILENDAMRLTGSRDPNLVFVRRDHNNVVDAAMEHFNSIQRGDFHPNAKNTINPNAHGKGVNVLSNVTNTFGDNNSKNWPAESHKALNGSNSVNGSNINNPNTPKGGRGIRSPLDQFVIRDWLTFTAPLLGNLYVTYTNMGFYLTIVTFIIVVLSVLAINYEKIVGNSWSTSQESTYATVYNIVVNQINAIKGQNFYPFIYCLFVFILTSNLVGMVPYNFAPTSHFALTFFISFTVVLGATILGFILHKLGFFSLFVPTGCPLGLLPLLVLIEFISYLARNVSLGLRLAANILSGHMLLNILSEFTYNMMDTSFTYFFIGFIPIIFIMAFSSLEFGIAFIQAQVFTVLSSSYIKDSLDLH